LSWTGSPTRSRRWEGTLAWLQKLAEVEPDADRRARRWIALAPIFRDQVHDPDRAIGCYDHALGASPSALGAFESIHSIRTERAEWSALEADYVKMLARAHCKTSPEIEAALWQHLGDLYRTYLGRPDAAADAFAAAARVDPANVDRHETLDQIYGALPGRETGVSINPCRDFRCDPS